MSNVDRTTLKGSLLISSRRLAVGQNHIEGQTIQAAVIACEVTSRPNQSPVGHAGFGRRCEVRSHCRNRKEMQSKDRFQSMELADSVKSSADCALGLVRDKTRVLLL